MYVHNFMKKTSEALMGFKPLTSQWSGAVRSCATGTFIDKLGPILGAFMIPISLWSINPRNGQHSYCVGLLIEKLNFGISPQEVRGFIYHSWYIACNYVFKFLQERTELANKQLLEQRSLKEQLEVRIRNCMFVEHFSTCMLKKKHCQPFISLNIICSYFHHYWLIPRSHNNVKMYAMTCFQVCSTFMYLDLGKIRLAM